MREEGDEAPDFELPAVHEGERETVALGDYFGENIVILAFYPGDFNPACSGSETGLDDLDLFTMQKDVSILAVSSDSVFSHEAFADEYDLHIPLLTDIDSGVAAKYGVESGAETHGTRRAVFVVGLKSQIEYAWVAEDSEDLPDVDELRDVVEGIGGDETARARYRVGNARYLEGRRGFTSAMSAYEDREWMIARGDFTQATEEFDTAREEFNTAIRFAEDETEKTYYERAERKAEALWRAADWLSDSANAFASGEGAEAERLRQDAEAPLETARDIHEPPDPDDFPPDKDPAELEDADEDDSILSDDEQEDQDTTLELEEGDEEQTAEESQPQQDDGTTAVRATDGDEEAADGDEEAADGDEEAADGDEEAADGDEEASIDDDELEEIAAELEQQTAEAKQEMDDIDEGDDGVVPDEIGVGHEDGADADEMADTTADDEEPAPDSENVEGELDEDDIELDLTDPTEGEDDEDDEEDEGLDEDLGGSGDHGVPDSL